MNILRAPYIKSKNFIPDPVVRYGIPRYADSVNNPKCVGTPDHTKFWTEQLHYILNGYDTGGMHLPGRFYYFMNFKRFDTVAGSIPADMCDLHLELAYVIEYCKENGKNFLCPKARRKGLSESGVTMIGDYGWRFLPPYNVGIAAGLENYVQDFILKWSVHCSNVVPELSLKYKDDKDQKIAQYRIKEANGWKVAGNMNSIYARTAFRNPNVFKGLFLNDILAEEMGEFDVIKPFIRASIDATKRGSKQYGNFWGWGTGGSMQGASKFFEEIWHDYEAYNCVRFFVDARRFYFPFYGGAKDELGKDVSVTPNLMHMTKEERYGVEDRQAAEDFILKTREEKAKSKDVADYIEFCQNTPLDEMEVFRRATSNCFDINILNETGFEIESNNPKYAKFKLDYEKTPNGEYILPLRVRLIPAKDEEDEKECVLIADDGYYINGSSKLYCAGLDSYDQDQSKVSKSLGAMVVLIRDNSLPGTPKMKPVALIRCRPSRKEKFYDMCLKLSVYYNLVGSVLVDVRNAVIIKHFQENMGAKYLARRPRKFESDNSEQTHEFGVSLNRFSKPRMVSLMQSYVLDHGRKIPFIKLINELKNYDEHEEGSDNDAADALGIALMQDACMDAKPLDAKEAEERAKKFRLNDHESKRGFDPEHPYRDNDYFGQDIKNF